MAIIILLVIFVGIVVTRNRDREFITALDKKEHPLKVLYPMATGIYSILKRFGINELFGNSVQLREIYVDESVEYSRRKQAYRSIASMIVVVAGICLLIILYQCSVEPYLFNGRYLKRGNPGSGSDTYSLSFEYGNDEIANEKVVTVKEIRRQGSEVDKLKDYAIQYLDKYFMGENEDSQMINRPLNLIKEIPSTGVLVSWDEDNRWIISVDGTLRNSDMTEPVDITMHATLTYFDHQWDFNKELRIMPYEKEYAQVLSEGIDKKISDFNEENPFEQYLQLPEQIGNEKIIWKEKEDNTVELIAILGLIAVCAVIPGLKQDLKKKQQKRKEQMLKDYSDIVSKFIMLLTAGMTCRAAWNKVCLDYQKDKKTRSFDEIRYAYEEMMISYNELQLGKSEVRVYEDFGIRCNVLPYQRFGTLLARNIRRGSAGLISMLELESTEAFADRREAVRRKGEETGTKLLIPMFGMLIIVFAMVIIPAFSSF